MVRTSSCCPAGATVGQDCLVVIDRESVRRGAERTHSKDGEPRVGRNCNPYGQGIIRKRPRRSDFAGRLRCRRRLAREELAGGWRALVWCGVQEGHDL